MTTGQYYQQVRLSQPDLRFFCVMFLYQVFNLQKMFRSILNLPTSQFTFNKCISPVIQMKYGINLKVISVVIMGNVAVVSQCISSQVSDAHLLENETESFKLSHQRIRGGAQSGNSY